MSFQETTASTEVVQEQGGRNEIKGTDSSQTEGEPEREEETAGPTRTRLEGVCRSREVGDKKGIRRSNVPKSGNS